jgi:hypothetical protein
VGVTAGFAGTERYDAARYDVRGFAVATSYPTRWLVRYAGRRRTARSPRSDARDQQGTLAALSDPGQRSSPGSLLMFVSSVTESARPCSMTRSCA